MTPVDYFGICPTLLLTLAHELFHVVQRGYVNAARSCYMFDEMQQPWKPDTPDATAADR